MYAAALKSTNGFPNKDISKISPVTSKKLHDNSIKMIHDTYHHPYHNTINSHLGTMETP